MGKLWAGPRQLVFVTMCCLLILPGFLEATQLVGDTTPKLRGVELIQALQKGGYVIYFRHGITSNFGEKDVEDKDLGNCTIQRNLSEEGQIQTKAIGEAFRTLHIPIQEVYSSPYCRCLETAKNIFGKSIQSKALHFAIHLDSKQRVSITEELLVLLTSMPKAGQNRALVSHTANLQEAVGIWPKPEGVAHIFKPEGEERFSYVGVMQPEDWGQAVSTIYGTTAKSEHWLHTLKIWLSHLF